MLATRPSGGPSSAADAAQSLTAVEQALRDPTTPPDRIAPLAAAQQLGYRSLAANPDWVPAVLAAVPVALRAAVQANITAGGELGLIPGPTPAEIPAWSILTPAPAAQLLADYHDAAAMAGVPWTVLAAIHLVESRMGRIRGPSTAGAQGPMQFLPSTWATYGAGGNIDDDRDAIFAAARLLAASGAPTTISTALFQYNHSTHYVRAVLAYASVMDADERAYLGYHGWQVYVSTASGTWLLPEGYRSPQT